MPGSLGNQRPLGCCHVQSNAGGEASWLGHYALTLPSVELQEKKGGGKKQKRRKGEGTGGREGGEEGDQDEEEPEKQHPLRDCKAQTHENGSAS